MVAVTPASVPVWTGNTGDPTVQHTGWTQQEGVGMVGWCYVPPSVGCPACGITNLSVASVRVTGGTTSLIWTLWCHECGYCRLYPATAYGTGQ